MQISDAELGALDMDRQVNFTATGKVFDITVSAVLGTSCSSVNAGFVHAPV
jgi:hypothetical protein